MTELYVAVKTKTMHMSFVLFCFVLFFSNKLYRYSKVTSLPGYSTVAEFQPNCHCMNVDKNQ